jgi:hypothetical protein
MKFSTKNQIAKKEQTIPLISTGGISQHQHQYNQALYQSEYSGKIIVK